MKYDFMITLKKGFVGLLTGLATAIIAAVSQAIINYNVGPDAPGYLSSAWVVIAPIINGQLVGLANWLKNRDKDGNTN